MAQPARHEDVPVVDPSAIQAAYRRERARRRARIERQRARRAATFRFLGAVVVLFVLAIVLAVTLWHQLQNLFGL